MQLWSCVLWRSGWLLTNRGQLSWINDWIIQWRRHRYHMWWQIIALWVSLLAIKAPVITRSVLWISGSLLTDRGHLRWIDNWIIQWRRQSYQGWWQLVDLWVTVLAIKAPVITRINSLIFLFPVPFLWWLTIPFGNGMMNAICVCGGVVCLLFYLLRTIKRWEPTFWRNNCSYVWVSVPGTKTITRFLSQYNHN